MQHLGATRKNPLDPVYHICLPSSRCEPSFSPKSLKTQFWRKPKYTIVHLESNGFPKKYEMKIQAYNRGTSSACVSGSCNDIHIDRGIGIAMEQVLLEIREGIISDINPKIIAL